MDEFLVVAAGVVGAAVVQEAVSRSVSMVLGKRKEKTSQGQYVDRLRMTVKEVEFVMERTAKMPITEVSLLRDMFELKRDFIEAACLLSSRHKKRQGEILQALVRSPSPQGLVARPAMFSVSSLIDITNDDELCVSCDDVKRFEQFAGSARSILARVESGCSLRRYMFFPCPIVRRLFDEWKTFFYSMVQADQERHLEVWPARLEEERGVEVWVRYCYSDHSWPDKSFFLGLVVRLSESTDIVGIAIKCLQSLASHFKFVADTTVMGELTQLASNLQDVSHSHAPPWVGIQEWYSKFTQKYRPDPLCCKPKGHGHCANNNGISSELSHAFPEEVIFFYFECYISAPEYSLRSSSAPGAGKRSVVRNRRPPLQLTVCLVPHYVFDKQLQASYATEIIGDNDEEECIDVSIQQVGETVRSRAINCFLRHPKVMEYLIRCYSKHGTAMFSVEKSIPGALKTNDRSSGGSRARAARAKAKV